MNALKIVLLAGLVAACLFSVSCVRFAGGTWLVESAPVPEGWPDPTPVGEVEIRRYPGYREAVVDGGDREPMFLQLFRHIEAREIAMTAPVDMGYADEVPEVTSMAFLYRTKGVGPTGTDGAVAVRDVAPETYASVGVRGDYDDATYAEGRALLEAWLAANADAWRAAGAPRYLGYNGPFVPPFLRYGEVQVPLAGRER